MVFHLTDNDFIPRLQTRAEKALSDQVQGFGGAFCPDTAASVLSLNQLPHSVTGLLKLFSDGSGLPVMAAVNGRAAVMLIIAGGGLCHHLRFKGGGGAVEKNSVTGSPGKGAAECIGRKGFHQCYQRQSEINRAYAKSAVSGTSEAGARW